MPSKSAAQHAFLDAWRKRVREGDKPRTVPDMSENNPFGTKVEEPRFNCGWCDVAFHDHNTLSSHEGIVHSTEMDLGRPRVNEPRY
jgi:hypothetical protein